MESQSQDLLKRLQHMQRLIERACAERDLAYAEAAHWKKCYEAEAHQRRIERSQLDESIQALEPNPIREVEADEPSDELAILVQERDQWRLALEQEKENHRKTRESLITALGDALHRK